jgi:hypothetical protein
MIIIHHDGDQVLLFRAVCAVISIYVAEHNQCALNAGLTTTALHRCEAALEPRCSTAVLVAFLLLFQGRADEYVCCNA